MVKFKQAKDDSEKAVLDEAESLKKDGYVASTAWGHYKDFKEFSATIRGKENEKGHRLIEVTINKEGNQIVSVAEENVAKLKTQLKEADNMVKKVNALHALKRENSDAIRAFDKAEKSMRKECAL